MVSLAKQTLRILHTNDLHSQLDKWPAVTQLLNERRNEAYRKSEEVLLFDIGDHCDRAHPMTDALLGKGNVQLLNDMAYDAVTIGNNEGITFSKDQLDHLYDEAQFPVVLSNLKNKDGTRPEWTDPYKIFTLKSGLKVGVTGVTAPFRLFYETLGWKVTDPFSELEDTVNELRPKVDILICLSHLGFSEDEKMADDFPSFDIILGAHTHHVLEKGKKVNNTWINQSGRSGAFIGEVCLEFEKETESRFQVSVQNVQSIKVNEGIRDEETEKSLNHLLLSSSAELNKQITVLESGLDVEWYHKSKFPVMLAETLREWCEAEISMVNSGVLLKSLPKGPVTVRDLHEICPHPINPATVMISGERLLETIRQSRQEEMITFALKGFGFRGKVLGYMVFDNLTISDNSRYLNEKNVLIDGAPLQRDRKYKLATLDMFTFGQLYPAISSINEKKYHMPEFLRDLLAWKLNKINGSPT
ncbi:2',3'-cyclic-nucleotide 2'-phosphodiesterase/5'-or 3'-nucleotidase, 5'-nucleotidase family [Salipaludibacillus aurantiacus]|uniref:2',3'-cyclic-nucleotide 2'-phosphodiesterase/5'-or 3'-nucleotidase, 5'-nucleotidase family n=1 Tax=Salipaludibacillus aurantiacus TaxID=1601833 RepID=A0A1H9WVN7_9BACI|nr:2',3'-cyclic-nucleotide 2'-phosphodiesterase/5'-or 3'-nucleotidase, 5'-nucleotidase family [Salipaludibacillus aurantiacus]